MQFAYLRSQNVTQSRGNVYSLGLETQCLFNNSNRLLVQELAEES